MKLKNVMPSSLVTVKGSDIEGDRTAANAMIEMFESAEADGVTGWQISAGYRSYDYQQQLFDEQVAEYRAEGFTQEKGRLRHAQHRGRSRLQRAPHGAGL